VTTGVIIWIVLFAIAASVFFGIALVVTIKGVSDVKDLLGISQRRKDG
jgi:hypothetical protein